MREQHSPMNQTMKISDVRGQLNTLVNQVYRKETRVIVEKSGIPVAALVSPEDLARLTQLDRDRAERLALLDELRAPFRDVPAEAIAQEVARARAEVRAEARAEQERGSVKQ